jgi:hypothetical protein
MEAGTVKTIGRLKMHYEYMTLAEQAEMQVREARANTDAADKLFMVFVRVCGTRINPTEHGDIVRFLGREYLI